MVTFSPVINKGSGLCSPDLCSPGNTSKINESARVQGPLYSGSNRWAKYVCPFVLIVSRPCFLLLFCFVFAWFVFCFVSPSLRCQPIHVMRSERGLQTAHRTNVIDRLVSARFRCVGGWGVKGKRKGVDTCTCSNRVTFWQQYCPHAQKAGRR